MEIQKASENIYTIHIKDNLLYVKQVNVFIKEFASCLRNRFALAVICCLIYHWLEVSR